MMYYFTLEGGKSNDVWLKGNVVMRDRAFGHYTPSSKMCHIHMYALTQLDLFCNIALHLTQHAQGNAVFINVCV